MTFTKAVRKSAPLLIGIAGPSGSGKTYSALLMAAGIAGPDGKVGFLDTENGRGSFYADSPGIKKALPNGYMIAQLDPPFTPARYIEAITAAEKSGVKVLVIDSVTHEYEGIGGVVDIAENNKLGGMPNWSAAKLAHKKFVNHLLSSNLHLVLCLRAREKVKIVDVMKDGRKKQEIIPVGMSVIQEKGFAFELLVSLMLDEGDHCVKPLKVPEPLAPLFPGGKMITVEDGERIRKWNETGTDLESFEQLRKRARAAAEDGVEKYKAFFAGLTAEQKKGLGEAHAENKAIAQQADEQAKEAERDEPTRKLHVAAQEYDVAPHPGDFSSGDIIKIRGGSRYVLNLVNEWEKIPDVAQAS